MTGEDRKNAYLYCKFRDEQFALYDEYAKRHGMLMKTLLVVNALFYNKDGMTQTEICKRTFQSKQTVNLIIKNLLSGSYVTVAEVPENKRNKIVQMTAAGRAYCERLSGISHGRKTQPCPCLRRRNKRTSLPCRGLLQKISPSW